MITTRLPDAVMVGSARSPSCTRFEMRQVLHRLVDARELAAGNRQVTPGGRAAGQHQRVELGAQLVDVRRIDDASVRNSVPSARICSRRRFRWRFSSLNSGMP